MRLRIEGGAPLSGEARVPADKSIVHRALIFAGIAGGDVEVGARAPGADNHSSAAVLRGLGVEVIPTGAGFRVRSPGVAGWSPPAVPLDCGNSGTTLRLMAGALAGAGLPSVLTGDASLSRRPMGRICGPLRALGAAIKGTSGEGTSGPADRELPPLTIGRGTLRGGTHRSPVSSAQVKSALLLTGVCGGVEVEVIEPALSRDHSERMLAAMGARIERERTGEGQRVKVVPGGSLRALDVEAPGDISSAAFLLAAAALVDDSRVVIRDVGLNATRTGFLEIVEELAGDVRVSGWREEGGEPVGDLTVTAAPLRAIRPGGGPTEVGGAVIPRLIDELVVLAALAARADGVTVVRDAGELRHKESDRIAETARLMAAFGVEIEVNSDGFAVRGPQTLRAATLDVSMDHRIALTAAVLALAAPGTSVLDGFEVAEVSFPELPELLVALGARVDVDRVGRTRA